MGTFEAGASVLQLRTDPDDQERYARVRETLRAARERRPRPARDDKVVTAWNGLPVAALAEAGALLDRPAWVAAAHETAELVLRLHTAGSGPDGRRLVRTSRDGAAGHSAGVLEDYACLAEGLLALNAATADPSLVDGRREPPRDRPRPLLRSGWRLLRHRGRLDRPRPRRSPPAAGPGRRADPVRARRRGRCPAHVQRSDRHR